MSVLELEDEIMCMMLIRGLPMSKYQSFVSIPTLLPEFTPATLSEAFQNEHLNHNKVLLDDMMYHPLHSVVSSYSCLHNQPHCHPGVH